MPELYLLHPIAVHFPIALLTVGGLAALWCSRRPADPNREAAISWLLWLGTGTAWAAMALGHLAENTAPHVPSAWEALEDHQALGHWTVACFTGLCLLRFTQHRGRLQTRPWRISLLIAWLAGLVLLAATAREGGELVFKHGMGVQTGRDG